MSEKAKKEKVIPFWRIIYKKLTFIILITVVFALIGLAYGLIFVKPEYTITKSLILKLEVNQGSSSDNRNEASITKIYFPVVKDIVTSEIVINDAKALAGDKNISASALNLNYGETSMIFTMSYTDNDIELAKLKLSAIIEASKKPIANEKLVAAKNARIEETQRPEIYDVDVHNGLATTIVIAGAIGLVVGVGLAFLIYFLDNTAKDKEEIEELTGTTIIANIENQ